MDKSRQERLLDRAVKMGLLEVYSIDEDGDATYSLTPKGQRRFEEAAFKRGKSVSELMMEIKEK